MPDPLSCFAPTALAIAKAPSSVRPVDCTVMSPVAANDLSSDALVFSSAIVSAREAPTARLVPVVAPFAFVVMWLS